MVRFLFSILCALLTCGSLQAQTQAVFFSESGEPFYLYLNNQLQNRVPQNQVKVSNLILKDYQVTIEFKDITQPVLQQDLKVKRGKETVYVVYREDNAFTFDLYTKAKRGMYSPAPPAPPIANYKGYSGKVSCAQPMGSADFEKNLEQIQKQEFTQSRQNAARQMVQSQCITVAQLKQLLQGIDYETERIEFAKFAYSYVYDRENYYQLADVFTYPQTIEEIETYIREEESR